jgi:hypothetical protein
LASTNSDESEEELMTIMCSILKYTELQESQLHHIKINNKRRCIHTLGKPSMWISMFKFWTCN